VSFVFDAILCNVK